MGREIRRVPQGWEHPKKSNGSYQPMYDKTYEEAAKEWIEKFMLWQEGKHPDQSEYASYAECKYYWDWAGYPPNEEYYRSTFDSEPTHYQIYETITEGTPTSPVFVSLEEMNEWLVNQGHSSEAAENFIKNGWCPSMVAGPQGIKMNIDACEDYIK